MLDVWRKFVFVAETMSDLMLRAGERVKCPSGPCRYVEGGAWQGLLLSCSEPCDACVDVKREYGEVCRSIVTLERVKATYLKIALSLSFSLTIIQRPERERE